jgi:hypothetical protein
MAADGGFAAKQSQKMARYLIADALRCNWKHGLTAAIPSGSSAQDVFASALISC